ncbi:hypothetical protein [Pseudanabaena sp. BC1403]|uniref:hypothetical protein n=1 Tax=Pseudanabaena sp. BC1403 TaxID=2043171 RepID=UPI000CD7E9C8|nr:hypothetical protein [Pseudanabaena sp. BC1403]
MYNLEKFTIKDMTNCGAALRKSSVGMANMEAVANLIVGHLYDNFINEQDQSKSFALVRLFKTHPYIDLEPSLQRVVDQNLGKAPENPQTKCLTLLATAGEQQAWNTRQDSFGHQAIPLLSENVVAQSPMISQLIKQFGLEIGTVLEPDPAILVDIEQRSFNVFHIGQALGNPHVPAQAEFVVPYGIKSVLGFGGMLPSGNLLAVVMFAKVNITRDKADMFKTLALNAKMALFPFEGKQIFDNQ